MEHANTGTPTDPIWWFVVLAGLFALSAITLFVLLDSVLRVLLRRWNQARELRRWREDVEDRHPAHLGGVQPW